MLSSKPIRNGDIYCSPRCGCKCKWSDYVACVDGSSELVRELGEGWEPYIYENMGWHFKAIHKERGLKVYPNFRPPRERSKIDSYTAFLGGTNPHAGGRWSEKGETPQRAIKAVMDKAIAEAKEIAEWVGMKIVDEDGKAA